ncbi:unnamed protein product, partial [Heterosigma akashiwo]
AGRGRWRRSWWPCGAGATWGTRTGGAPSAAPPPPPRRSCAGFTMHASSLSPNTRKRGQPVAGEALVLPPEVLTCAKGWWVGGWLNYSGHNEREHFLTQMVFNIFTR